MELISQELLFLLATNFGVAIGAVLLLWLISIPLRDVSIIDISPTRIEEQRTTPWMQFESLEQALDPRDSNRTIEGYPAPVRAIVTGIRST